MQMFPVQMGADGSLVLRQQPFDKGTANPVCLLGCDLPRCETLYHMVSQHMPFSLLVPIGSGVLHGSIGRLGCTMETRNKKLLFGFLSVLGIIQHILYGRSPFRFLRICGVVDTFLQRGANWFDFGIRHSHLLQHKGPDLPHIFLQLPDLFGRYILGKVRHVRNLIDVISNSRQLPAHCKIAVRWSCVNLQPSNQLANDAFHR